MYILIENNLIKLKKVIKGIFLYLLYRSLVVKQHSNKGKDTI